MTNYKPTLQECAMRYGTGMGLLWAFKFMLFPLGLRIPFLQLLFIVLTIGVPFLGYIFAKKFRERHCDGSITFSRAFLFTTFMYMFASLFVAVVHYIYFRYIDGRRDGCTDRRVRLRKIHHGAFYDGPSAAKYTHYGAHVFKWRKWARGFK